LKGSWPAFWVIHPNTQQKEYGIYHFRKTITFKIVPKAFLINVTADNKYRLFVNGRAVCSGPARGDVFNWYFETVNIAPFLKQGDNVIAAMVWNMGELAPVAQISNQTAFLLQGNSKLEHAINTSTSWKALKSSAYKPCSLNNSERLDAYTVVGPLDQVDAAKYPWSWEKTGFDDRDWVNCMEIVHPDPAGYGTDNRWTLSPRNIPLFKETQMRFPLVRRAKGITLGSNFLVGKSQITIPANQSAVLLLDKDVNTIG
jgi:alpha-L-rhamnosidase